MSFREKKHKSKYRFYGAVDIGKYKLWFGHVAFVFPVEISVLSGIQKKFCARNTDLSIISIWIALISR